jgi:hypothetical protein
MTNQPTIRQGSTGPVVSKWQKHLGLIGDGQFGPETHRLTIAFQRLHGLQQDGVVGPSTWAFVDTTSFGSEQKVIPNKLTPVTPDVAAKSISDAYKTITGSRPTKAILGLMLGQWAGETGNGESVHNFNFGNGKATSSSKHVQYFRCWERDSAGNKIWYDPPAIECRFAAYLTPEEGAIAFINLLKRRDNWWKGLHTGTVKGFVKGLAIRPYAYFTDDVDRYEKLVAERTAKYADVAAKYARSTVLQVVVGLAVASAGVLGYNKLKAK